MGLNRFIVPVAHPLPLPMDMFNRLCDDKFFLKLAVCQAYYHIPLAPESCPPTAFVSTSAYQWE